MNAFRLIMVTAALPSAVCADETIVSAEDLKAVLETQETGMPSTDTYRRTLCVSESRCFGFEFVVSSKGNGVLAFPGGWIRIYDNHAEKNETPAGLVYNELSDVNGDGFKDVKTGIVDFLFDPETNCFVPPFDPLVPVLFSRGPCARDDT